MFRTYSASMGRWLAPDPYDGSYDFTNPQSFNRYAYVMNNPLAFADPLGLYCPIHVPGCKQGVGGADDGDLSIVNITDPNAGSYSWATGGLVTSTGLDNNGNLTLSTTVTGYNDNVGTSPGILLSWSGGGRHSRVQARPQINRITEPRIKSRFLARITAGRVVTVLL